MKDPEADLNRLNNLEINDHRLRLTDVGRGRFIEERNFKLFLENRKGVMSANPVMIGKYFAGRGRWLPVWIEIIYFPRVRYKYDSGIEPEDLIDSKIEKDLLRKIGDLVPAGGRLFFQYEELKGDDTAKALSLGVPAVATRLGGLLWDAGFRWFKDWYYPEGWLEGGAKLQANKPGNAKIKRQHESNIKKELQDFIALKTDEQAAVFEPARLRAVHILQQLG